MQLLPLDIMDRRQPTDMNAGAVLLVGVKLSGDCRELLTWIIAKLAKPGDRVIAVHVVRAFTGSGEDILDPSTKKELDNTFESVLGVYQSICSLKQVRLDIKVVSGTSLRKALLEATKLENASKLILGGNKHDSEPLAKYCLKHLHTGCSVLIVEQGKVVYAKEGHNSATNRKVSRGDLGNAHSEGPVEDTATPMKLYGQSKSDRSLDKKNHTTGWSLMHRSVSLEKSHPPRGLSVVKWALQLPDKLKVNMARKLAHPERQTVPRLLSATDAEKLSGDDSSDRTSVSSSPEVPRICWKEDTSDHISTSRTPSKVSFLQRVAHMCRNTPCVRFTYQELQDATKDFSIDNVVGKGGYSKVYKGTLLDGRSIAVKRLKGSGETDEELLREVEILTTLGHPHIVTLLGYYADTQTHILVYDFATEGNLEENLHSGDRNVLNWSARHRIAIGAAEALVYLHDSCATPVVHRDIKSSNILLFPGHEPKISDFGLAKWASTSATHITCTDVVGTLGYLAPEYFMFGRVNDKTDVYAFGVVLLELISGRPPIDMSKPKGDENLVQWARPLLDISHREKLVDARLKGNYDANQVNNMIAAAAFCLRQSPQYRPRMTRVLRMLFGEDSNYASSRYDIVDDEFPPEQESNDVRKHLALAMMGVDDDVASQSSADQSSVELPHYGKTLDDYLGKRYSRSSSFDS